MMSRRTSRSPRRSPLLLVFFSLTALLLVSPAAHAQVPETGDPIEDIGKTVGDAVTDTGSAVGGAVQDGGKAAGDTVTSGGGTVGDAVGGDAGKTIKDTSGTVGDTIESTTGTTGSTIGGGGANAGNTIKDLTSDGSDGDGDDGGGDPGGGSKTNTGRHGGRTNGGGSGGSGAGFGKGDRLVGSGVERLAHGISSLVAGAGAGASATGESGGPLETHGDVASSGPPSLAELARDAAEAARRFAFPLILTLLVLGFLVLQDKIDSKETKLVLAPVSAEEDLLSFR